MRTEADELLVKARQHLREAHKALFEVVIEKAVGYDEYSTAARTQFQEDYMKLSSIIMADNDNNFYPKY